METILLRQGKVIDGKGSPAFDGHVLIAGDRIEAVLKENEQLPHTDVVVDVGGWAIAPGFIDVHSHHDFLLPLDDHPDYLKCLVEQGVTTIVGGNCGVSPAPVSADTLPLMDRLVWTDRPLDYTWSSMNEFLGRIQDARPIVNLAQLVGHATLRTSAGRTPRGAVRPDELRGCLDRAERSLAEGACGLSFGLGYDPGLYSPNEEVEAFAAVASKAKKPVTAHLKAYSRVSTAYSLLNPRPHNLIALKEMIDIARRTDAALQISHLMVAFRNTWPTADECLSIIEDARRKGVDVMADAIPYPDVNGSIVSTLPTWLTASGQRAYDSRWARTRARFEMTMGFRRVGYSFSSFRVMDTAVSGWEHLDGLTVDEIAREWRTSPADALLRLGESSRGQAIVMCQALSSDPTTGKPLEAILSHDLCLFGSDALIRRKGYPNPAASGTFPKILGEYVREKRILDLQNAVKRMTSLGADRFGLKDRGRLEPGKAADIVIFDTQTISEATVPGKKPGGRPVGIAHVFVNGRHVVKDGAYVDGARAGRVLRV